MKNVIKKYLGSLITVMLLSLVLAGCGKDKKPEGSPENKTDELSKETGDGEKEKKTSDASYIDITSKEEVNRFITGKWRLVDTVGGGEFATLVIYDDGRCEYDRDSDNFLVEGNFAIKPHQTYDAGKDELVDDEFYTGFDLSLLDIPEDFNPPGQDYYTVDDESVDGNFHISRGDGYDYLYLEWVGNGDSYIFGFMFQNAKRLQSEYDEAEKYVLQEDMVFRRVNEGLDDTSPEEDKEAYGLIWESGKDESLWIQTMDVHSYETEDEYTGRKYKEGYFTGCRDMGLKKYELSKDADTSLIFSTDRLAGEYPLMMCRYKTDEDGRLSMISEVDRAFFGKYDLGSLKQEYSYNGLKFKVNGFDFDLKDKDSEASEIISMEQVGDWIVVRAAIPPHYSEYYLVNVYTCNIEKTINGENLTWVNDDITTAVYSSGSSVYNFKDHIIGTTDGAGIRNIGLKAGGKKVILEDEDGKNYTFELEDDDEAMYRYADFALKKTALCWRDFINCAPDDAIAYVMVNPPEIVKSRLSWLNKVDEGSEECVYVVALKDGTTVHADYGMYDYDKDRFETKNTFDQEKLLKGSSRGYEMSVTEGIPYYCIYISTKDKGGMFPVSMISGKSDQCGMFIKATMSAVEAIEKATIAADKNFDLIDSYMDILFKYKEAQDNKYSQEKVENMGLRTELVQLGWPSSGDKEAVKYVFYDIDKNGTNELIITYNDSIIDIWASDGKRVRYVYGCPYRGSAALYENGMLEQLYAPSMNNASTTWYKFNTAVGDFFPDFQMLYEPAENDPKGEHYYTFAYESGREEIEHFYSISGEYPEWIGEWGDEITKDEYDKLCSKEPAVKLPEGERIADFKGL